MTTVLEKIRHELSLAVEAPVYTDTEPYRPVTMKLSMLTAEHGEALLAVAEAAAAIPGWTTLFDLLGKIEVLKAAIAPLMKEGE